jgi:glycosyltransferase involved in cell wall biosynthesis
MKNLALLLRFLCYRFLRTKTQEIRKVHAITFRRFSPEGGRGGGSAVQSCQQILLGERYHEWPLTYTYYTENRYSENRKNRLWDLWGGAYFAIKHTRHEHDAVYFTHDYGTGFGLALLRKKFVYIAHLQGPRIEEKNNFGEYTSKLEKGIIRFCEWYVFKKAHHVCFPSKGAEDYYFSSQYRSISRKAARIGPVLYNTLYVETVPQPVEGVKEEKNCLTILSIGACTAAKGIDQIPALLDELLERHSKPVRWIVVGSGALSEKINKQADDLANKYPHFTFKLLPSCSYPQIVYLHRLADIYIMLQRVSIFDLATLEAMKHDKAIILSAVGGNLDFNKQDNIILHTNHKETVDRVLACDVTELGNRNRTVYDEFFSQKCFVINYHKIIDDLMQSCAISHRHDFSSLNFEKLGEQCRIDPVLLEYSEMSASERNFIAGLVTTLRPKKMLEIGVSSGASSALLLGAGDSQTRLHSIDTAFKYYRDRGLPFEQQREVGFLVRQKYAELTNRWSLYTGGTSASFMEQIGSGIDFVLLDAAHGLPGELLDFLTVLPFVAKHCVFVVHDINIQLVIQTKSTAPRILMSCVRADKIFPVTGLNGYSVANIGAFMINQETAEKVNLRDLFHALLIDWCVPMNVLRISQTRSLLNKCYPQEFIRIFDDASQHYKSTNPLFSE